MSLVITSAHQPSFLPWVGYLHKFIISDNFVIMDIAKFKKKSFMHRNCIEINQKKHILGLRVGDKSEYLDCDEIKISDFHKNNLKEIELKIINTYKNHEFFKDLEDFIKSTFDHSDYYLNSLFLKQINFLKEKFKLDTKIIMESDFIEKSKLKYLSVSERLLSHAIDTNAKIYITGINSINYLDKAVFENHKIYNHVQKFNYLPFLKYQHSDEPLSIIHQIAKIGYKNLKKLIFDSQESKKDIINIYDRS